MHRSPAHGRRLPVLVLAPAIALVLTAGATARPIDLPPTPLAGVTEASPVPVVVAPRCHDVKASRPARTRR